MADKKISLQLTFDENLKRDTNLPTTDRLAFDDLGDFIEERERLSRLLERRNDTDLKVDYSDFENHVFFDFAVDKLGIATNRVLNKYPFNGTSEEKDAFALTGSGYENYLLEQWPREVAYTQLNGTDQYITASDSSTKLYLGSSSLYVSAWADPVINDENVVLQKIYKNNNLIKYSNDFENSEWTKSKITLSASSIEGPFSGSRATTVVENISTPSNYYLRDELISVNASGSYTCSGFFKASNRSWALLFFTGTGLAVNQSAYFNIATGAVGVTVADSASIEDVGDGWFRAEIKFTAASDGNVNVFFMVAEENTTDFSGIGQDSWHVYGTHLQEDPCPSFAGYNYVATTGSQIFDKSGYELIFSGASDPHLKFTLFSGAIESSVSASYTSYTGSFNNVAAVYDEPASLVSLYINDTKQVSSSVSFGSITSPPTIFSVGSGSKCANVFFSGTYDFYSGSLNEVRVSHTASELFHTKNYNRPITAEDYVKLHYKFNEGVTGTGSVDSFVVDYSQSGLHGRYLNYVADESRISGSVMNADPGDPILYSFDDRVVAFTSSLGLSASLYDLNNNNNIFNLIPEGVLLEDDLANGLLRSFSLAMARFFDDIKLYMDQFVNARITNYDNIDETPDIFLPHLKRYFGWKISEHFNDANPLEFLFGENVLFTGSLDTSLLEIRNQFWRRTLNNFPLLMKSKGTRKNVDYLFNVLGLNKDNIKIKEYGYLPGTSIQDERIAKQKVQHYIGIGTGSVGSLSSSFVTINSASLFDISDPTNQYTIETMVQLPFASASYSGSILSGALWELDSSESPNGALTSSIRCYWERESFITETGKLVLEASSSTFGREYLTSSNLDIFNGDFVHVAAGSVLSVPFISVRVIDGPDIIISEDFTGSAAFNITPTSNHSLFIGANTGSVLHLNDRYDTQGFFGQARYWDKKLSGSELDDHALNFQSIGTLDPFGEDGEILRGHWALNEDLTATPAGTISGIVDLSRNSRNASGVQFTPSENPYEKYLQDFNYLSPSLDLKWTENKIRIRNKSELKFSEVASDTNEVSLEFNLIDSLNEDIVKIFATLDTFNDLVGQPIFKYRDEYSDLEGVRRDYFQRLGDQLNFTQFFHLFKWFDKKISDAVKQILPARVKFIGGEQVIESHLLERPKYKYHYPVFRTPQEVPEIELNVRKIESIENINSKPVFKEPVGRRDFSADYSTVVEAEKPFESANGNTVFESQKSEGLVIDPRPTCANATVDYFRSPKSAYADGADTADRNPENFFRIKVSGDNKEGVDDPSSGINFKNEFARRLLSNKDRDNE